MATHHPQITHPALARLHDFWKSDLALVWGLVFLAWVLVFLATLTGQGHLLHHDSLFETDSQPLLLKLLVFLIAWQVMTVAMMLPASLPLIRLFAKVSSEAGKTPVLPVFLAAYLTIWTGFALLAFLGDLGLHHLIDNLARSQHPGLLSGTTLIVAGAFQFSGLKEHCLKACRHPLSFLTHHYQRGLPAAWNLGIHHGLYCLGCCWALMLVMFAVGVSHLTWMLVLTGVMVIEKTSRWSRILVPVVGVGLIVWGTATLLHPAFLSEMS